MAISGILWQDLQHTELLRHVRILQRGILEQTLNDVELAKITGFLRWYVQMHFSGEDAYMVKHAYPQIEEHRLEHKQMTDQLEGLFGMLDDGMGNVDLHSCAALCVKLNKWYLTHIAGPDQKLATFIKAKGVN